MEERYKNTAQKKQEDKWYRKDAPKKYYPIQNNTLLRKRNKLAELLLTEGLYQDKGAAKAYAKRNLETAAKYKSLQEWADDGWMNYTFILGIFTKQPSKPTREQQLTWDVHTGLALTKLYGVMH